MFQLPITFLRLQQLVLSLLRSKHLHHGVGKFLYELNAFYIPYPDVLINIVCGFTIGKHTTVVLVEIESYTKGNVCTASATLQPSIN